MSQEINNGTVACANGTAPTTAEFSDTPTQVSNGTEVTCRKNPDSTTTCRARQWDGTSENATDIINWALEQGVTAVYWCQSQAADGCAGVDDDHVIRIQVPDGFSFVEPGEWVVQTAFGELHVVPDAQFRAEYTVDPAVVPASSAPVGGTFTLTINENVTAPLPHDTEDEEVARSIADLHSPPEHTSWWRRIAHRIRLLF